MGKMNYSNWKEDGKSAPVEKASSKKRKRQNLKDVERMIKESSRLGREMFKPGKQSDIEDMMRKKKTIDDQILTAIRGGII